MRYSPWRQCLTSCRGSATLPGCFASRECRRANVSVCLRPQLILFGLSNQLVVSYKEESTLAFKQLFVKDYGGEDADDYSAAVYTQQDLYDSVSYVVEQVAPAHTPPAVWFEMWGGCVYILEVSILHEASVKLW